MKKIILLLICLLPLSVNADYSITNYRINMTVLPDGDLEVIEAFSMDGIYNGYEKEINYKNIYDSYSKNSLSSVDRDLYDGKDVVLKEIRSIDFLKEIELTELITNSHLFKKNEEAKKGEYGFYNFLETNNGVEYKIYNPSMMNKDFYISYIIKNIAISHKDISELALNIFKDTKQNIDELEMVINIPNNENILKIWIHGANGIVESNDNKTIKITIKNIDKNADIDFRMVFDVDNTFVKNSDESVLDKIINIEDNFKEIEDDVEYEKLKENAYIAVEKVQQTYSKDDYNNAIIEVKKLKEDDFKADLLIKLIDLESKVERKYTLSKVFLTSIMGILLLGLLITLYHIYAKYDHKYIKYKEKYYEKLPEHKSYIVSYLLNKKITKKDLFATIFYLLDNNKISLEKTKKDYKLKKISTENLSFSEERCIKFLFNKDDETTLEKMKKRAKKHYNRFIHKYSNWLNAATYESNLKELYEDLIYIKIFGVSYCIISIVICVLLVNKPTYFSPIIVIIIFVIFALYFSFLYKKTKKGNEYYYKYKAFKRYIKNKKINENVEKYLCYAISFGCENKIIKDCNYDMKDFIKLRNAINESLDIAYKMTK